MGVMPEWRIKSETLLTMSRPLNVPAASYQNTHKHCSNRLNLLRRTNNPRAPHLPNRCHRVRTNRKQLKCANPSIPFPHSNTYKRQPCHPLTRLLSENATCVRHLEQSSKLKLRAVVPSHNSSLIIHLLFDIISWRTLTSLLHRTEPHAAVNYICLDIYTYIYVTATVWFGERGVPVTALCGYILNREYDGTWCFSNYELPAAGGPTQRRNDTLSE